MVFDARNPFPYLAQLAREDAYLPPITPVAPVVRVIGDGVQPCLRCGGETWAGLDVTPVVGGVMHPTCAAEARIENDRAYRNHLRRQHGDTERS